MRVVFHSMNAIAIRNAQYLRMIERSYHDTIVALSNSVEARDHYTVGHTWRVTHFALQMAREMGWSEDRLRNCEMGGILHDVGKIAVEDAILRKPDRLTDEEFAKMKIHPEKGARMLQDIPFLKPVIPYCLYHHERLDGRGVDHPLAPRQGALDDVVGEDGLARARWGGDQEGGVAVDDLHSSLLKRVIRKRMQRDVRRTHRFIV